MYHASRETVAVCVRESWCEPRAKWAAILQGTHHFTIWLMTDGQEAQRLSVLHAHTETGRGHIHSSQPHGQSLHIYPDREQNHNLFDPCKSLKIEKKKEVMLGLML